MYTLDVTKIAETLRILRLKANPNVTAFAKSIGVNRMTVTKFEQGKITDVSLDTFVRIINGLEVSFDDVVPHERNTMKAESITDVVIKSLETLSEQHKLIVCQLLVSISELSKKSR
jgi:transcriptional regulator with XRE-family HTH domain